MMEINTAAATATQSTVTQYEMADQLARKMSITLEEARNALEASDWNMLTATHLLEQEAFMRKQQLGEVAAQATAQECAIAAQPEADAQRESAEKPGKSRHWQRNLRDQLRRLLRFGNQNRFTIHREGEKLLDMPVTALALLLICSFGTCALLMVFGLFAGCRYSIAGRAAQA